MDEPKTVFIDIETTGLVPTIQVPGKRPGTTKKEQLPYETQYMEYPYIVSMAWKINLDGEAKEYIINQEGREIPKEASDINGITTEIANASPYFLPQVINKFILDAMGNQIVSGHNIYFDSSIIKANVLREQSKGAWSEEERVFEVITAILHKYKRIDTMRSTIRMMGKWSSLSDVYLRIFRKGFKAHNAKNDVQAQSEVYGWLLKKGIIPTLEKLQQKAIEKEQKELDKTDK